MSGMVLRDRILVQMLGDAEAGRPSTQLSLAEATGTTRGQVCIALGKLQARCMVERGSLLGAPPNRGTYSYRITPDGRARANTLGAKQ